jgi:hypothetical protein
VQPETSGAKKTEQARPSPSPAASIFASAFASASAPQKKEPVKQQAAAAAGPKFRVPVLSESEKAAIAAKSAAAAPKRWDGWD